MSRFSRNTATTLGYLLFAGIGGTLYMGLKSHDEALAQSNQVANQVLALPIPLGPSSDDAIEIPSYANTNSFHDPVIDLTPRRQPTWLGRSSLSEIDELTNSSTSSNLPTTYPYQTIEPVAIPRSGDAFAKEPEKPFMSFIPANRHLNRITFPDANNMAATQLQAPQKPESWPDQGVRILKHLGTSMLLPVGKPKNAEASNGAPQPIVQANPYPHPVQPASTGYEAARQVQAPSTQPQFIIQPGR
jgi:hypothetical protein